MAVVPQNKNEMMAETILRQGEIFLESLLQIALSSDQRAATLAAIFTAGAVAVAAALTQVNNDVALLAAGILLSSLWFVASFLCVVVLWPTKYHLPGNYPSLWMTEDVLDGDRVDALLGECENYDERIRFNVQKLALSSKIFKAAMSLSLGAPLLALVLWGIIKLAATAASGV